MAKDIHKSEMTVKNSLAALEKAKFIVCKHQGVGQPNKIYVKIPLQDKKLSVSKTENCLCNGQETVVQEGIKLSAIQTKNCTSNVQNTVCQMERKLSGNNNYINNINYKERDSNTLSVFGTYKNVFLSKEEYSNLKNEFSQCNEYIERLSSYMVSTGKTYKNHEAVIRSWIKRDCPKKRNYDCGEDESL